MAYTLTKDDVVALALAPELGTNAALLSAYWDTVLAQTMAEVGEVAWGTAARAQRGAANLVAHRMTVLAKALAAGAGGGAPIATGALASVTVGAVSKSWSTAALTGMSAMALQLQATRYGQEYYRLLQLFAPRAAVI